MTITNKAHLVTLTKNLMGGSYDNVSDDGFSTAIDKTLQELPWKLPLTDNTKEHWLTERARRHVLYIICVESAHKFKYKEISLQHRFANYFKLIEKMDEDFEKAIEDNPDIFSSLSSYSDISFYITTGFVYDEFGRDITHRRR